MSLPSVRLRLAALALVVTPAMPGLLAAAPASVTVPNARRSYEIPLSFEKNEGQTNPSVRFVSRGSGYTFFLTGNRAILSLAKKDKDQAVIGMSFKGAAAEPRTDVLDPQEGVSNYLGGADPSRWIKGVRHYGRIAYKEMYPGIDVVFYGNNRQLEYDFVLRPGADPTQIRMQITGADRLLINGAGELVLRTSTGDVVQKAPVVYQEVNGERRLIAAGYRLNGRDEVAFDLGKYDRNRKLVIDPVLVYSTYFGGLNADQANAIAVDSAGGAYIAGLSASITLPGQASVVNNFNRGGNSDAFVTRYNPAGTGIAFTTFLGGSGTDTATGIAVDANGIYVTGATDSLNFPLLNPVQNAIGGLSDAFVTKLDLSGTLVYSSYFGGLQDEAAQAIKVDSQSRVYFGGITRSTNFWATGGFQGVFQGGTSDGFVVALDADGKMRWSTYLGSTGQDYVSDLALDADANVYVTGTTTSFAFPTTPGASQRGLGGNSTNSDAFVTKFLNTGGLSWSTYVGGNAVDQGAAIAVDADRNVYMAGDTEGGTFAATAGAAQTAYAGGRDSFVVKLNSTGSARIWATFLGGSAAEFTHRIALDAANSAYIIGTTASSNFPTTSPIQAGLFGVTDAFVTKLSPDATSRVWSTYLGGSGNDEGLGIAVDNGGAVYVAGFTSADFPTATPVQTVNAGATDAFVAKMSGCDVAVAPQAATYGTAGGTGSFTITATNCAWSITSDAFIHITSGGTSGTNSAVIQYSVDPNAGAVRSGNINVSGIRVAITQAGTGTAAPFPVGVTPSSGNGNSQLFTASYGTANPGGLFIERVLFLINTVVAANNSCMVEYNVTNNTFRVVNDAGNNWTTPALAGSNVVQSNSQCSLNVANSSAQTVNGTGVVQLNVNMSLSFANSFAGTKNIYMYAVNDTFGINSGWQATGTYTVTTGGTGGGGGGPDLVSLVPTTGAGGGTTFSATFSHSGGVNQIYLGYIVILPTPNVVNFTAGGTCIIEYNRVSNGVRLINNAGNDWIGPLEGVPVSPNAGILANNACLINISQATVTTTANSLTFSIPVNVSAAMGFLQATFLQEEDVTGKWTDMRQFGNWLAAGAQRPGPIITAGAPPSGTGSSQVFSVSAAHTSGAAALTQVHLRIAPAIVTDNYCHIIYFPATNTLNLVNDQGSALVGADQPVGGGVPLSNSRCTIVPNVATASVSGNTVTVGVPVFFNAANFGGAKNVYADAFDNAGLVSHWVQIGTFTIQ